MVFTERTPLVFHLWTRQASAGDHQVKPRQQIIDWLPSLL